MVKWSHLLYKLNYWIKFCWWCHGLKLLHLNLTLELLLDAAEDTPYCVIISLTIWVFSFIYFTNSGYFIIFSCCRWRCFSFYWFGKREFGKFMNGIPVIEGPARSSLPRSPGDEVVEIITSNIVLCWARILQVGVAKFLILFNFLSWYFSINWNHFTKLSSICLFKQHLSLECFPLASINDINKLVPSIYSASSLLVRKCQ